MSVFAFADGGEPIFPVKLLKLARVECVLRPHAIGTSEGVTSGTVQTTSLPGGRWEFTCYWDGITGADGFELQSFFRQAGRRVFKLPMGAANPPMRAAGVVLPTDSPTQEIWKNAVNNFPIHDGLTPLILDLDGYAQADMTGNVEVNVNTPGDPSLSGTYTFVASNIHEGAANALLVVGLSSTTGVFLYWDNGDLKIDYRSSGATSNPNVSIVNFRFQITQQGGEPAAAIQVGHNPAPMARNAPVVAATLGLVPENGVQVLGGVVSSEEWVTLDGHLYRIEEDVSFGANGAAVAVSPFYGGAEPTAGKDIAVELGDAALARVVISDSDLPSFELGRAGLVEGLTITMREV